MSKRKELLSGTWMSYISMGDCPYTIPSSFEVVRPPSANNRRPEKRQTKKIMTPEVHHTGEIALLFNPYSGSSGGHFEERNMLLALNKITEYLNEGLKDGKGGVIICGPDKGVRFKNWTVDLTPIESLDILEPSAYGDKSSELSGHTLVTLPIGWKKRELFSALAIFRNCIERDGLFLWFLNVCETDIRLKVKDGAISSHASPT